MRVPNLMPEGNSTGRLIWLMTKVGWYRCEVISETYNPVHPGIPEWITLCPAAPTCHSDARGWPYPTLTATFKFASRATSTDDIPPTLTPLPAKPFERTKPLVPKPRRKRVPGSRRYLAAKRKKRP